MPSLRFGAEVLDQPQQWSVHFRGLEYCGEVIVALAFRPALGMPLPEGLDFRLVFFTMPRRIPVGQVRDTRIAMAVPRRALEQADGLSREAQAIREAQARYQATEDVAMQALARSMEEREQHLLREVARRHAALYAQGRIYTSQGLTIPAREVFFDDAMDAWANRLAAAILAQAHPSVPLDFAQFPRALDASSVPLLYHGLFQGDSHGTEAARAFGPGLGLTRPDAPAVFNPQGCRVFPIIQDGLDQRDGQAPAGEVLDSLIRVHGLTRPLALLYLLAFVCHARAEATLKADHQARSVNGEPFLSDTITWDLVPEVAFSEALAGDLALLRQGASPTWNAALPYMALLVPHLAQAHDPRDIAEQERRLLDSLATLSRQAEATAAALAPLRQGDSTALVPGAEDLEHLRAICAAGGYLEFHALALRHFGGPSALRKALGTFAYLRQLADLAPAIARARRYLAGMTFGPGHEAMALERDALAARVDVDSLEFNPSLWGSIEQGVQGLRRRYAAAYSAHHASYHAEARRLRGKLEQGRLQLEAFLRLQDIPEMGGPFGTDLPERFKEVAAFLRACSLADQGLDLEEAPYCQVCLLPMGEDAPSGAVEHLLADLDAALREYHRRLGFHAAHQVLAEPSGQQLEKFIQLLHVADPSALGNVLDQEVVAFLRQFLRRQERGA